MPNLMQILSIFLKLQAVKQTGPVFSPTMHYSVDRSTKKLLQEKLNVSHNNVL